MSVLSEEWYRLQNQLQNNNLDCKSISNQFFHRLLIVLSDDKARTLDKLLAYKDALKASPKDVGDIELPIPANFEVIDQLLEQCNLAINFQNKIQLIDSRDSSSIDMSSIYQLRKRRFINQLIIDPALKKKLDDDRYQYYNGAAQQIAVRLTLTSEKNATLLVNLPTGCGKTLVAHALSLFSPNNKLTLVIVPTTALAIDQGKRAGNLLDNARQGHGGVYYWAGNQPKALHEDIKQRIREQQQKILFCSPEAACKSLLPTLFSASENGVLANIVIDEAHLVDQWGVGFRPYFQIFSSVVRALRGVSPEGLKCILMSATFTEKTVRLLMNLFGDERKSCIEIYGNFLRPEIQYHVVQTKYEDHTDSVINAIYYLPKPMIVYAVLPEHAKSIFDLLKANGLTRIGLFTGPHISEQKDTLINKWGAEQLDIMVATSAFGVGMDKLNVRSVLHIAVPENMDRFYQEVGRGGRDGNACQSLLIYYEQQFDTAYDINNQKIIGTDLGLKKWQGMWDSGSAVDGGRRKVSIANIHKGLKRKSKRNELWNRRTLLLMQRAEIIQLTLEKPEPPEFATNISDKEYKARNDEYYQSYYEHFIITPLINGHLDESIWVNSIKDHRKYEKDFLQTGFDKLKKWIKNYKSISLCHELAQFYTIKSFQPEYACGGCPKCRESNRLERTPTLGFSAHVLGAPFVDSWKAPLSGIRLHKYIYYPITSLTNKKLLRRWLKWLTKLIELDVVQCICAENAVLEILNDLLPLGIQKFWIGIPLEELNNSEFSYWSCLVLVTPSMDELPELGWEQSTKLLIAPENIKDEHNYNCLWWEKKSNVVSLSTFLLSF